MPSYLSTKAARSTSVPPKYFSDGKGRDTFISFADGGCVPHSIPRCPFTSSKTTSAKRPPMPKYIPNGSGRDLFCQVAADKVVPSVSFSKPVVSKREVTGTVRHTPPPTYKPTGSGRDLFIVSGYDAAYAPRSTSFRRLSPSPLPRPRTAPPPKFISAGSGRDSFQNPNSYRPNSPVRVADEGFVYGSRFISKNARYKFKGDKVHVDARSQRESSYRLMNSPIKKVRPKTAPASRR
mmetsp:Transcript_9165/g.13819  ORF Transcript_9165/g.13819 Transcript_9165/m.13819 type:complete len:236 (+) Transcript_9165:156-863(+)|eukprot:CAMPEP_0185031538 /NCGR_PEP_ID=MMETSP1103-20130426/19064_1 /TAXON_ID=36769 /ORGANISM="Paraphysomonas bandaiensis, Strain Caron Lab Isolate" /LENGTH=235 /DNA_ID=CAMNT_0027567091 /DNA_START=96 /DNA_END=806 /DNA_ORIENTATION=-